MGKNIIVFMISLIISGNMHGGIMGNNPVLTVNAVVALTDGTGLTLNEIHINNSTELTVYAKPKIVSNGSPTIKLEKNPHEHSVGAMQLSALKKITLTNPNTTYLYQKEKSEKEKNGLKDSSYFIEAEIDGIAYLMPRDWRVSGTDAGMKKHTLGFDLVQSITITGACAKTEQPAAPCPVCPVAK